jgi:hypothetical protein
MIPLLLASCAATYDLMSPVPDACLGVIDTDRPHQTDTPHLVPAGHAQLESALVLVPLGGTVGAPADQRSAHVALLDDGYRFGVTERLELALLAKHVEYVPAARRLVSPGPLGIRAKWSVVDEHGFVPAVTIVPWVMVPFARDQALRAGPLVFWGWELAIGVEIEMNAGVFFGTKPKPVVAGVLATALTLTLVGTLRVFIDIYATGEDVALGTGALLALARDVQIDAGTYIGLHGEASVASPFLGLSLRR